MCAGPPNDLLSGLVQRIGRSRLKRLDDGVLLPLSAPALSSDPTSRKVDNRPASQQFGPDFVLETRVTARVGALLSLRNERATVWHLSRVQTSSTRESPNATVLGSDQTRSLWISLARPVGRMFSATCAVL